MLLANALREGHLTLVILAALNTAIAIYYYLSVVRVAYTAEPEERPAVAIDGATKVVGLALLLLIVALGVMPTPALDMAAAAVRTFLL